MDRLMSFDDGVQLVRMMRDEYLERLGGVPPWVDAAGYRDALSGFIRNSEHNPLAWDGVRSFARRLLRDGQLHDHELVGWVGDRLEDKRTRPTRRGRDPYANLVRDKFIVFAVRKLEGNGFSATRNKPLPRACEEGGSACDAVGEALGMGYSRLDCPTRRPAVTPPRRSATARCRGHRSSSGRCVTRCGPASGASRRASLTRWRSCRKGRTRPRPRRSASGRGDVYGCDHGRGPGDGAWRR